MILVSLFSGLRLGGVPKQVSQFAPPGHRRLWLLGEALAWSLGRPAIHFSAVVVPHAWCSPWLSP